jgi:hypothetical protein
VDAGMRPQIYLRDGDAGDGERGGACRFGVP